MNVRPQLLAALFAITALTYPINVYPAQTNSECLTIVSPRGHHPGCIQATLGGECSSASSESEGRDAA